MNDFFLPFYFLFLFTGLERETKEGNDKPC